MKEYYFRRKRWYDADEVDAAKTLSSISQDSQMDFYEEFIKNEVNNG